MNAVNPSPAEARLRQACAELERRLRQGEPCRAEDYLTDWPGLAEDADAALDLVYTEYLTRAQLGRQRLVDELLARFPRLRESLARQLRFDSWLADSLLDEAGPSPEGAPPAGPGRDAARPYEILEEVGRGGMAVVCKARHKALGRVVALKMIDAQACPRARARFASETLAVARLQHPNIVQLFEVGEQDGRPFLALEYVEGDTLARRLAGTPQPPRAAAELLVTLARAVQHAHEQGVIHRDLKPANVLLSGAPGRVSAGAPGRVSAGEPGRVSAGRSDAASGGAPPPGADATGLARADAAGLARAHAAGLARAHAAGLAACAPKIADFGLAKLLDRDGQTHTGQLLGTPSYMAPEQIDGRPEEVGPAADVYGLGAILYEALTGRPPFKGQTPLDTLEQVRRCEPVPPRRLQPGVPADLETICLKCLRKEPAQRYATAGELADDLGRYLDGKPVRARPLGALTRLARLGRRRPLLSALALGLAASVLLGVAGFAYQWRQTLRQRNAAEERFRLAHASLVDIVTLAFDPQLKALGHEGIVRRLREEALEFYQGLLDYHERHDGTLLDRAIAQERTAYLLYFLGREPEALAAYRRAVPLWTRLVAGAPDGRVALDAARRTPSRATLASCLLKVGQLLTRAGDTAGAAAPLRGAWRHLLELHETGEAAYGLPWLVSHVTTLAQLHQRGGRHDEALALCSYALGRVEGLPADRPVNVSRLCAAAVRCCRAAGAHVPGRGEVLLRCARLLERATPGSPDERRFRASALESLAWFHYDHGPLDRAEAFARRALLAWQELAREKPERAPGFGEANSWHLLGVIVGEQGRRSREPLVLSRAADAFREAAARFGELRASLPEDRPVAVRLADSTYHLGCMTAAAGDPSAAICCFREALRLREAQSWREGTAAHRREILQACWQLGNAYERLSMWEQAGASYRHGASRGATGLVGTPRELGEVQELTRRLSAGLQRMSQFSPGS